MTAPELAAEMKALRESIERLRKAIEYLTALKAFEDLAVRLRAEEPPRTWPRPASSVTGPG